MEIEAKGAGKSAGPLSLNTLAFCLRALSTSMLVAIVAINIVNVIGRYCFDSPLSWGDEVMLFLMIGAVFLSFPVVTLNGDHIRMDLLARMSPPRIRRALEVGGALLGGTALVLLGWGSVTIVDRLMMFGQRSEAAEIPVAIPQGAIPVGLLLGAAALVLREVFGKKAERGNHRADEA
jgi:TRAP-type C4-dicarboxylate transport system permease small subunit